MVIFVNKVFNIVFCMHPLQCLKPQEGPFVSIYILVYIFPAAIIIQVSCIYKMPHMDENNNERHPYIQYIKHNNNEIKVTNPAST